MMEDKKPVESKEVSAAQAILIKKIMKSRRLKDSEYRELNTILENQVLTSYDASVFIGHVLSLVKFRRLFLNGKHKAYKRCFYCDSRNQVERYLDLSSNIKKWVCESCAVNLDSEKVVPVKLQEANEVSADLMRKSDYQSEEVDKVIETDGDFSDKNYDYPELTTAQEDLVCSHREE